MLFLICLDPLLNKRIHKASANIGYHEHNNEEVKIWNLFVELFWYICYKEYNLRLHLKRRIMQMYHRYTIFIEQVSLQNILILELGQDIIF